MDDITFLRSVAQNDYMIDNHYLPTGVRLLMIADALERKDAADCDGYCHGECQG